MIDPHRIAEKVIQVPEDGPYRPIIFNKYLFPVTDTVEQHGIVIKQTAAPIFLPSAFDAFIDQTVTLNPMTREVLETGDHIDSRHLKGNGETMWEVTHEVDTSTLNIPNYSLMTFYRS
jgi:hypothetical protein